MSPHLPMSRIRTIIKSSADVDVVGKESTYIITRAAELFIKHLSKEAYKDTKKGKKLDYRNVANVVNGDNHYEFLREIIPKKITVQEYYKLTKDNKGESEDSSSEDSSSSDEEDSNHQSDKNNKDSSDSDCIILD